MKKTFLMVAALLCGFLGCEDNSSDARQRRQQELILSEGTSRVGMPAIKNFRERKILKEIIELRDQGGLATYTYLFSEMTGKLSFLGETIGYGIPAATQFTNPEKPIYNSGVSTIPQADPNGLFSPSSAEGTWVLMLDRKGGKTVPVYIEPRIIVSPFRLE